MGLAKYLMRWEDDPTTPGERVQFRMPNWTVIEEARAERTRRLYADMRATREVVGPEVVAEWKEQREAMAAAEAVKADAETTAIAKPRTAEEVLNDYDRLMLYKAGIGKWTYCEPVFDEDGNPMRDAHDRIVSDRTKPIPVTEEAIAELTEDTQKWIGLTLVALIASGFRPIMPVVEKDDRGAVIDIRPGVDSDPLERSSGSAATWQERTA